MPSDEDKVRALAEYVAAKRAQEVGVIESCYSRVVSAAQGCHGTRLGPESQDILLSLPRQGPGSGDIHEVSVAKISLSQGLHSDVTSLYEQVQPHQPLTTALCKEQESTNPRGGRFSSSGVLERVSWTESSTAMPRCGVGLKVNTSHIITGIVHASPAWRSQLAVGDVITEIDKQRIMGATLAEVVQKLMGVEGSSVSIGISTGGCVVLRRHKSAAPPLYLQTHTERNSQNILSDSESNSYAPSLLRSQMGLHMQNRDTKSEWAGTATLLGGVLDNSSTVRQALLNSWYNDTSSVHYSNPPAPPLQQQQQQLLSPQQPQQGEVASKEQEQGKRFAKELAEKDDQIKHLMRALEPQSGAVLSVEKGGGGIGGGGLEVLTLLALLVQKYKY